MGTNLVHVLLPDAELVGDRQLLAVDDFGDRRRVGPA
jgi:hypothetical protein